MRYAANAAGLVGAAFRTIMRCLQRLLDARLSVTSNYAFSTALRRRIAETGHNFNSASNSGRTVPHR
jgi:hypothetical protein